MSEFFGKYKRPKEEIKQIQKFIKQFNQSKAEYKLKNLKFALSGFISGFEMISDIFDIYPKAVTLNLIIKIQIKLFKYNDCFKYIFKLKEYLPYLLGQKREAFIKLKSKIFFYEFILNFLCENLDKCLFNITEFISYLKENNCLTLEEKVEFFWVFLKKFIKLGQNLNSRNFAFFKQQYNSMIVDENINKKKYENFVIKKVKRISRDFVIYYKTYMNNKLKKVIYENLDKKFYFYKYGEKEDKIINFLNRNIEPFIQTGVKKILIEKFQNYLLITKIDLKKRYNKTIYQLIYEQKIRITTFNTAFLNIVGAFNQIFKNYLTQNDIKIKPLKSSNSMTLIFGKEEIKKMEQNLIEKLKIIKTNDNSKTNEKNSKFITMPNFNSEFKVPPIGVKTKKIGKNKLLYFSNLQYKNLFNCSYKDSKIHNFKTAMINIDDKNSLPVLKKNISLKKGIILKRKNRHKILELQEKLFLNKIIYKKVNFFLVSKFNEIYEYIVNYNNKKENNCIEKISNINIDNNLINLKIYNSIIEKNFSTLNGELTPNKFHTNCFIINDFMIIKNFYLLGLCESRGNYNAKICKLFSTLLPSFLNYLLLELLLSKENKDFNDLIIQLIKIEESSKQIKDKFLLSYINDKLKINFKYFPSLISDFNIISNIIYETLFYIITEVIQKYEYQFHPSGINLCSIIVLGKLLYILNVGHSKALICFKNPDSNLDNKWDFKSFSVNKNNKNNKKLILMNNNGLNITEENKNKNKDIIYNLQLSDKESLLIGKIENNNYDKKGILFEQELVKLELNTDDKIIIIGSKGFWKLINNEEVVNYIGKFYDNGSSTEEVSKLMVEIAKNKLIEEYKMNVGKKEFEKNFEEDFNFDDITCMIVYLDIK